MRPVEYEQDKSNGQRYSMRRPSSHADRMRKRTDLPWRTRQGLEAIEHRAATVDYR